MAGNCVLGWLFIKQKQRNGALYIDVVDNGGEKDCRKRCDWWYYIGIAIEGVREEDTLLGENQTDNDELELLLLTFLPLCSVFPSALSLLSL